ncbi:MAG: dienelactone hydrolase family protein [Actinomycetota bacterium]|nr:MAG: dienelactone hydrolase family protein [Actinomycetota bacterium]
MPAYVAVPDARPTRGVVVLQEAFGVNEHIRDVTRRLADAGYHAVAPALFHRSGAPELGYGDPTLIRPHMAAVTLAGVRTDVGASLQYLADAGYELQRTAVVGFCMGGSAALIAAVDEKLGAAVTFYGGGIASGRFGSDPLPELASRLQTPWLGLYADEDPMIPIEEIEQLREGAAGAPVSTELVRYAGVGHGFNCDVRSSYNAAAATDAWGRTLAWLDTNLG